MPSIKIGTADFRAFSRALNQSIPTLRKSLYRNLAAAGEIVAADARSRCTSTTTKISVSTAKGEVAVVAKGGPITGLLEDGNKGSSGGTSFRHPVYGNADVWVSQPMHPYLKPALRAKTPEALELIAEAIDETFQTVRDIVG